MASSPVHIHTHTQCIVLYDYDPAKIYSSETSHQDLKVAEGNLLRCYKRVEDDGYMVAEVRCIVY